jgi:hypothetical protein
MNKFKNIKTNGYSSKKEAGRAVELKLLQKAGLIRDLREQVMYVLAPSVVINGRKRPPLRYFADFVYVEVEPQVTGEIKFTQIIEDSKGVRTEGYKIKRHLMMAIHNLAIRET